RVPDEGDQARIGRRAERERLLEGRERRVVAVLEIARAAEREPGGLVARQRTRDRRLEERGGSRWVAGGEELLCRNERRQPGGHDGRGLQGRLVFAAGRGDEDERRDDQAAAEEREAAAPRLRKVRRHAPRHRLGDRRERQRVRLRDVLDRRRRPGRHV